MPRVEGHLYMLVCHHYEHDPVEALASVARGWMYEDLNHTCCE